MVKIKKIVAVVLCLIMAVSSFSLAFGEAKDYEGHWAQETIQKWIDEGKISGYPDGSFKPDANVTRAEFVKMVNGIIDYDVKGSITFDDVKSSDWYYDFIRIAQEIGYISGYSKAQFGPNDNITREQAASILARIQYLGEDLEAAQKFVDKSTMSSWASGSVGAASNAGFINGYSDNSFKPLNKLTRAEAVTMLNNVLENAKNTVVYKAGTEIKDWVVEGDLIIAKTVGEGDVHLTNVTVTGNIYVYGGGLNSVYFNNVKAAKIVVEKDKVRLVLDGGSKIEELALGSEAVIENENGQIAKVTITADGKVTLSGSFDAVVVQGTGNLVLDNAKIKNLVVEEKITITGKGTIETMTANADGIQYEAAIKINKVETGSGVTEKPAEIKEEPSGGGGGGTGGGESTTKPVVSITAVFDGGTPVTIGPVQADYTSSSIISDVLVAKLEELIPGNESKLSPYLSSLEGKLREISIDGTPLYDGVAINDDVWNKVIDNRAVLPFSDEELAMLKMSLEGELKVADLLNILSLHEAYRNESGALDLESIENTVDKIKEKADEITFSGIEIKTKKGTKTDSDAIEFAAENVAFSTKTVDEFFTEFGDITIKSTYNGKSFILTIKKDSVPK